MKSVVIIGATSAIAEHIARQHAEDHDRMILVGRKAEVLEGLAADMKVRGAQNCHTIVADLVDFSTHENIWSDVKARFDQLDIVYFAHGVLPDQEKSQGSYDETFSSLEVNALSTMSLVTPLANHMERVNHGSIVVISSVAGDRGRQSNYVYGSSKALLNVFCQGLRSRLQGSGVSVTTVKPGFVDTPMTAEFEKGALWASPESVGKKIVKAARSKKDEVYVPAFWGLIMLVIKMIPESIFKRLTL